MPSDVLCAINRFIRMLECALCSPFLHSFLHPADWNADVMGRALAAIFNNEDKGYTPGVVKQSSGRSYYTISGLPNSWALVLQKRLELRVIKSPLFGVFLWHTVKLSDN